MMRRLLVLSIALTSILLSSSCGHAPSDDDAMIALASNLPAVADAVETEVIDVGAPPDLNGTDLLSAATAHDPTLLAAFKDHYVTARREGNYTSVLVCDSRRQYAELEDTACTSEVDVHLWRVRPRPSCDFKLDLQASCK